MQTQPTNEITIQPGQIWISKFTKPQTILVILHVYEGPLTDTLHIYPDHYYDLEELHYQADGASVNLIQTDFRLSTPDDHDLVRPYLERALSYWRREQARAMNIASAIVRVMH